MFPYSVIDEDGEVVRRFMTKREALHFCSSTDVVVYDKTQKPKKRLTQWQLVCKIVEQFEEESFPF